MQRLKSFPLVYLATPYTHYPRGIEVAFEDACSLAAALMQREIKVYSPIAHTHPIAMHGGIDPKSHSIWLPFDEALMDAADALVVAQLDGWQKSDGIAYEAAYFMSQGKPIFYLDPVNLVIDRVVETDVEDWQMAEAHRIVAGDEA